MKDTNRSENVTVWLNGAGLLKAPRIEVPDPCLFVDDGQLDGIIQISTSGEYGVMSVYVILEDDQGKQIECGDAIRVDVWEDYWGYIPSTSLRSGTPVTVRAMDPLGGVGIRSENITPLDDRQGG